MEIIVTPPMVNEYGALNPMAFQQMMLMLYERFMTDNDVEVPTLMKKYGVSWVLLAMSIEVIHQIMPGERLTAEIWNTNRRGVIFRRDVKIMHADGSMAARGAQFFSVLDMQTRRISRDEEIIEQLTMQEGPETVRAESRAVYDVKRFSFCHTRKVHPSWIDELGHTNNGRYGEVSYDAISEDKRERFSQLDRMEIYFLHELKRDEKVDVYTAEDLCCAEVLGVTTEDKKPSFYTRYRFKD